jgi:hypothetical protein
MKTCRAAPMSASGMTMEGPAACVSTFSECRLPSVAEYHIVRVAGSNAMPRAAPGSAPVKAVMGAPEAPVSSERLTAEPSVRE